MTAPGIIIAAPHSGAGKTSLTTGLIAALTARGMRVQPFKCGPDYIDPGFHTAAAKVPSYNLDAFAMASLELAAVHALAMPHDLLICEGVMGLFDAGPARGKSGAGSTADIAAETGWPVILVMDVRRMAQTAGAIAAGCAAFRDDVKIAGVILNRMSSDRHANLVREGVARTGIAVFGGITEGALPELPSRHLGLVQADERRELAGLIVQLSQAVATHVDLDAVLSAAGTGRLAEAKPLSMKPPGQRIALAQDAAFSFIYPHLIAAWRNAGATILPFSPLADEAPNDSADALWLPGGYPELHAGTLAEANNFRHSVQRFSKTRPVHGECGGYMALGESLIDADGTAHRMLGLLSLETSMAMRRLHLGYRRATLATPTAGHDKGRRLIGHEFHYATINSHSDAPLATITDASSTLLTETGSQRGNVTGSFFHMIATDD